IPVWTTECEREDLPAGQRPRGNWGTDYCGGVPCFETCGRKFAEQWKALHAGHRGPTALLLLHQEFQRDRKEYGGSAAWLTHALNELGKPGRVSPGRGSLWLVVQGYDVPAAEEAA